MKKVSTLFTTLVIIFGFAVSITVSAAAQTIPTFSIVSVVPDKTVTIQTSDFPANDTFTVTMGIIGTKGVDGSVVGTTNSGEGGSFQATYTIPPSLVGADRISIRLQSPTSGFFAFNWFLNNTANVAPTTTPIAGSITFPSFFISSVVQDKSVTILTSNFPPNDSFTVTMGEFGTLGIGGMVVGTTQSGTGGSFSETYTIPAQLTGMERISIRLQSPTSGFFAFNWFFNNTASVTPPALSTPSGSASPTPSPTPSPSPVTVPPGTPGFPTFSITAVVADKTVTIKGANFPANDTFDVLMGTFGTAGVGGTKVGSTNTGAGGGITATYNIPSSLAGSERIAIRLQSPTSGFFSFNWFWNTTSP